ncbi:GNAT family N-acetyltransferase [Aspergillus lucknowensis]|uniref:GNAT domain-containing protein n=1 Tax=Aspergillus lucknowensis TaxID=176173 RepID=A0ABR4M5B1_9EURO
MTSMTTPTHANPEGPKQEPTFQTARLTFTPLAHTDAAALHELRSEQEVMKWTRQGHPDESVQDTQKWLDNFIANNPSSTPLKAVNFAVREVSHLELYQRNSKNGGVWERVPDRIVGTVGIWMGTSEVTGLERSEVGYSFVPAVWGRGYASEAVLGIAEWWFGLTAGEEEGNCQRLFAIVEKTNRGSVRVMEKCGFQSVAEAEKDGMNFEEFCLSKPKVGLS